MKRGQGGEACGHVVSQRFVSTVRARERLTTNDPLLDVLAVTGKGGWHFMQPPHHKGYSGLAQF